MPTVMTPARTMSVVRNRAWMNHCMLSASSAAPAVATTGPSRFRAKRKIAPIPRSPKRATGSRPAHSLWPKTASEAAVVQ